MLWKVEVSIVTQGVDDLIICKVSNRATTQCFPL